MLGQQRISEVFEAGRESARDPKYVVVPQRERIRAREEEARAILAASRAAREAAQGSLPK